MKFKKTIYLFLISILLPFSAQADEQAEGTAKIELVSGLSIEITQHLDFGSYVLGSGEEDSVVSVTVMHDGIVLSGSAQYIDNGVNPRVTVVGLPNSIISIVASRGDVLSNGEYSIPFHVYFSFDPTEDGDKQFVQQTGESGTIRTNYNGLAILSPGLPDGIYTGTYTLTAFY